MDCHASRPGWKLLSTNQPDGRAISYSADLEERMPITRHNPAELFPPYRNYSHAIEIRGDSKIVFISGLNGYLSDGKSMPDSFEEQGELIWVYIGAILKSAGMNYDNIVSLRT